MAARMNPSRWYCVGLAMFATALMALGVPTTFAQTGAAPAVDTVYVPTMTFDVVSVRENKQANPRVGFTMSGQFTPHTTNLRLVNWSIDSILSMAYGIDNYQIVGSPHWPFPTVFVIQAKSGSAADTKMVTLPAGQQRAEQEHMLQVLLTDRFVLRAHWETKQGDNYHLVVAKGGPKLGAAGSMPLSTNELKIFGDHPVPQIRQKNDKQGYDFIAHDCPINNLVSMLTPQFGRPVIDKTGLTGKYDFVVKYRGRWDRDRDSDDMDPMLPLDQAIQGQLGLKLESAKGPVEMLVIDHIEQPSEN